MSDASFNDAGPGPLRLRAQDAGDVPVISALLQDAILTGADITFDRKRRQLAMLINRFRWEDADDARREQRPYERVRALLVVSDITAIRSDGIDRGDADEVLSLLSLNWQPEEDGTGWFQMDFSGDGTIRIGAECVAVDLRDVTRPYAAVSGRMPDHADI